MYWRAYAEVLVQAALGALAIVLMLEGILLLLLSYVLLVLPDGYLGMEEATGSGSAPTRVLKSVLVAVTALPVLYTAIRFGQAVVGPERLRGVGFGSLVVIIAIVHIVLAVFAADSSDAGLAAFALCVGLLMLNTGRVLYRESQ